MTPSVASVGTGAESTTDNDSKGRLGSESEGAVGYTGAQAQGTESRGTVLKPEPATPPFWEPMRGFYGPIVYTRVNPDGLSAPFDPLPPGGLRITVMDKWTKKGGWHVAKFIANPFIEPEPKGSEADEQ